MQRGNFLKTLIKVLAYKNDVPGTVLGLRKLETILDLLLAFYKCHLLC